MKNFFLVVGSILLSLIVSTVLGKVALQVTPFGHMVRDLAEHPIAAQNRYPGFRSVTLDMSRLVTFVLDPITAVVVGIFAGLCGGGPSRWIALVGILPLAAFSAYSCPRLWQGSCAALMDALGAFLTAYLVSKWKERNHAGV